MLMVEGAAAAARRHEVHRAVAMAQRVVATHSAATTSRSRQDDMIQSTAVDGRCAYDEKPTAD
jgi:hypothetical protein